MNNYDAPVLNGQRYNIEIDSKTNSIKFRQQLFGNVSHMIIKNTFFKKNNEKRQGFFSYRTNKFPHHDDVQKNIIGILPF